MIKCLPEDVRGKLRSGVAIPSLQQCIEELILNSVDAEATCVGVRMDMDAFKVQVVDNGAGMNAEDMERVGNRYHTSKCSTAEDLDNLRWYGFRGEALASVVSLATLVEISTRTRLSVKTHVKIFKDGQGMGVFEAEAARPSSGTTVVVCDFLHNMPVRRKRMDAVLEGERIRHRVEAVSLMHPSVSFTLKNDRTGAVMVQLPKATSTYHRFAQIHGLGRAQKLGEIRCTRGQFGVTGHVGREGHYSNSLQFLYVNARLLQKTRIHKLLNFLLRRLSSSNPKSDSPHGPSVTRSPKHKRSQELHAVYVVNIECPYSEYDICLEPAKTLIEFKDWDGILLCMEEAVKAFLSRENLVAVLRQDDLDCEAPTMLCTRAADHGAHYTGNGGTGACRASSLDCAFGIKLASGAVYRKRKDGRVGEDGVGEECGQTRGREETKDPERQKGTEKEGGETHKEESLNKANRSEALYDHVRLKPPSDGTITVEEERSFIEAGEDPPVLPVSNSVGQPESEKLEPSKEKELLLSTNTSSISVIPLESIHQQTQPHSSKVEQIVPDCQSAGGHEHTLISNRRISLSHPFIHENLLTRDVAQINISVLQQQDSAAKTEERPFASKRKISLYGGTCRKPSEEVIPKKILRVSSCQRLSLCKEPGSLEKFRRICGPAGELKFPPQEKETRLPQIQRSHNWPVCQKDQRDGGVDATENEEMRSGRRRPPTSLAPANLKPVSGQSRAKLSLAAKLFYLTQHKTEKSNVSTHPPRATSQDGTRCRGDGVDNEEQCDAAANPEPVLGRCEDPLLAEEEEEDTASGDWLQHYDASVGKTVYINKTTGLSRYEGPAGEETRACCTSDVTNMAVSVVSEMGLEYRCYPFQVKLVLPFLPKSRTERVVSSGLDDRGAPHTDQILDDVERTNSLKSMYSKWNNPVFVCPSKVGVDISSGRADGLAVKIHNILFPYRFSKAMIHSMKVIHQVDKKFLACLIDTRDEESAALAESEGNLLVLVDQHAAHERVRLENLLADSYEDDPEAPGERRLCSSTILPPLEISVTEEEQRLLRSCEAHLRSLGLEVKFSSAAKPQALVGKVPLCFMEKESNEVRRGRPSVIKTIVKEYLQEQIELLRSTGRVRGSLPLTVLKVLASLACHGAIKFNDSLSRDECCSLVASLSSCQLPFQCAHGRPSIAPLVDTLHLDNEEKEIQKPNLQKLRRMYRSWELYGNR
uniref:DNA mismatch repair protein Mlh3 isoform X1 n=1 Tax=Gasterosteus aculeatus aculeatus TaxID=481459 RepID=UPI001A981C13|nr:DNA mismatch repair protein Mlh3 isoform X1 [Gasterosteus aculeatus aculeatus]